MKHAGFSLVELISVMVIIGILAAVALPSFTDVTFDRRGFYDQTMAALRYAQKTAIASRRDVCVTFGTSPSTVSFAIASSAGSGASCDTPLTGPTGVSPFTVTAQGGVTYTPGPTGFRFDALGRPSPNAAQTFQVTGLPLNITIEKETGHVHP
jgi:MSHA pilin protein MshC